MVEQHSTDESRLGVGLLGWQDVAWADTYYPDDLPADWRLSYYANELNCVCLAESDWCVADEATWQEWVDAVAEGFRFYLLASPTVTLQQLDQLAALLGEHLGGLLLQQDDRRAVPAGMLPVEGLSGVDRAWQDAAGNRVLQIDLAGLDLRAQRVRLEEVAAQLSDGKRNALLLVGEGVGPVQALELRMVAEMLGVA